jgi:hypothetical protein
MLCLSHAQREIIDKVDHTARLYCPTLWIISPCTCDKHNICPHCKTMLSYLVDYLPLYMWQPQHLTTMQDDIVLPCRVSPLVHVTTQHLTTLTARRYCPTLSIISPCTCDKHNIWPHCKTILSYLVDYLPLYMWQTQHLTTLQDDIVLPYRLSPLVHVTNTTSDHIARRYCTTLSIISPCTCDKPDVVFFTCARGDNRQGRTISSCNVVRCCVCHMYKGR